jgi:glutaredoxin-related protein
MDTKIIVYGAEWCGFCHAARRYLDDRGVKYDYRDVEHDANDMRYDHHRLRPPAHRPDAKRQKTGQITMAGSRRDSPLHPDAYGYGLLFTLLLIAVLYIIELVTG